MAKAAKPRIWRRRWVLIAIAMIASFAVGLTVGAGAQITRDANPRCGAPASVTTDG
ncbi:hypothetical protein Gbro_0553 [Gordonia bronchialis DSM 43247]|uniref:Uncharacterized protein n=1 Tax=Gordonia bronchialis (strain ATCC 25592 / DSM 43247 / BCRC 13721 / JCM 3198 / KCTC 3076 / NBRC 16047 / NCTC 10667) TaxID=526226 RepID=D0LEG5_GORB4|nr:hypothetical protein [Gordonia bronchialis]ACY19883.1 hypothetical protein Gbro_0553 [Gordonia bronchialis DSM 43247]MCC3322655.1 hypothetical protein [Gordonia bronchialis]QGS26250.1 hypothetical protein FOB84_21070 [Gordonia bronchialis]STQ62660.1 Uncharacterised protein [Gordonia bronchialis]